MSFRYSYRDIDGEFGEEKLESAKREILPRFLALPPKRSISLGREICTDIYITTRQVKVRGLCVGLFVFIIMPETYSVQQQPIKLKSQAYKCTIPPVGLYMDHIERCVNQKGEQIDETVWVYPPSRFVYRDVMNRIYETYVNHHFVKMGMGYRPGNILVDDPSLAILISGDLRNSGTAVEVVIESKTNFLQRNYLEEGR